MRYVASNRPFVIKNGAKGWKARKTWNASYLTEVMAGQNVNVAITPHGNADSVASLPNGGNIFVKPYETEEPFSHVLQAIQTQEQSPNPNLPTRYAQTQNDNLRNEYQTLFTDVPKSIPFAKIALEKDPDAINFWLGNSHSTTALHKDNYENIYVQILGKKHFVLLPPIEAPCVNECSILAGTYSPRDAHIADLKKSDLCIKIDDPEEYVPFATWDPDDMSSNSLFLGNLSFDCTAEAIREVFAEYGEVTRVYLPVDRVTNRIKGFGYVDFTTTEEATAALKALNGREVLGRAICIDYAAPGMDHDRCGIGAYSVYSKPLRVTLDEGDMLYLPALWYHKVSQSCNEEGICCAVNYWYDLNFGGSFWSMASFVRSVGLLSTQRSEK